MSWPCRDRPLNARYRQQFREPMDAPAWATYQAVKILYEAAFFGGSLLMSGAVPCT